MCLPVSRLLWVSSLAYPNLLGTKDYVVVVVVVVIFEGNLHISQMMIFTPTLSMGWPCVILNFTLFISLISSLGQMK
jgi:hypothetical protein